jgi:gas vesicle protein
VIVRVVTESAWVTAAIATGSALLGAVVGGLIAASAGRQLAERAESRERLRRSHEAAAELLDAVYRLSREVIEATAKASPAQLAVAANNFFQSIGRPLASISDAALIGRITNHRSFTVAIGIGGTPAVSMIPPQGLLDAFRRHSEALMDSLDAYIQERPLPPYEPPPLTPPVVLADLMAWQNKPEGEAPGG